MAPERYEWQIAVFCYNERRRIGACLRSIATAIGSRRALITLIVNGSTDGSEAVALAAREGIGAAVQVFRIPHADKSNAINCFLYDRTVRAAADLYFFVDGSVTIGTQALAATAARLGACPGALVATGIASNGRTEAQCQRASIEAGGVLRGQFYALRPEFVARIVAGGLRLPTGLYRGDGLLNSMAAHDLDALGQPWTVSRLISVAEATFEIDALSVFRPRDLRRQFNRKIRQMRGRLENAAIKEVIYAGGYAALPMFADDMIRDFLAANPVPPASLPDLAFMALALRQHRNAVRPDADRLRPHRIV